MLVTALRDGMNLVAKEYVACRTEDDGVLVLSEFTGAAEQLTQAVTVNPYDITGLKASILQAVRMPQSERRRRMRAMRRRLHSEDVARWSADFLGTLRGIAATRRGAAHAVTATPGALPSDTSDASAPRPTATSHPDTSAPTPESPL
jgi:trehalose-6-phosphate synthase